MSRPPENTPPEGRHPEGTPPARGGPEGPPAVMAEPEAAAALRVATLLQALDTRAPEHLHRQVRELVERRRRFGVFSGTDRERRADAPRTSRELIRARLTPTLAAMAIAAVAGIAVALLSGTGAHRSGTSAGRPFGVEEASALTLSAPTAPAPRESTAHDATLDASVDGVAFPYWAARYGWRASGERTDTLAGHPVTTVFYASPHGGRIGYAIVGGAPVAAVAAGTPVWRSGVAYRIAKENGAPMVTWQRSGHLCVLSGRHVNATTLLDLAAWRQPRAV
ncbi:MAG TPA: hypothetical protein VL972_06380 [Solirubrobacteraceae bacterium]|nr:hypothetical protein [Solirubrobacteraceae bacterium]